MRSSEKDGPTRDSVLKKKKVHLRVQQSSSTLSVSSEVVIVRSSEKDGPARGSLVKKIESLLTFVAKFAFVREKNRKFTSSCSDIHIQIERNSRLYWRRFISLFFYDGSRTS